MQVLKQEVVVAAPTGIAAFNVNGLTIHRLLNLPIEKDGVSHYQSLSNNRLKNLRDNFKDVILIMIDEYSMVSNILTVFIHLSLSEIFATLDENDGWFGRINILVFGDFLQLPPVHIDSVFLDISKENAKKYFSTIAISNCNLWKELFSYDELTINMRQQKDKTYANILSNVRLGILSFEDTQFLLKRQLKLNFNSSEGCLFELCDVLTKLPSNTVCLLATNGQCFAVDNAMLSKIDSELISLRAVDSIEAQKLRAKE